MIIALTGQLRSGTAAVAEVLHRLGCPVATEMGAPAPPTWQLEWEDTELSVGLARGLATKDWLRTYLEWRLIHAKTSGFAIEGTVALKSAFLATHAEMLEAAAAEMGEGVRWVVMDRAQEDINESVGRIPALEVEMNAPIVRALGGITGFTVNYDRLVREPMFTVVELLQALGIEPQHQDFHEAVARVRQPEGAAF